MAEVKISYSDLSSDPLAYRTGRDDAILGYEPEENPFLLPENREAWARGHRMTPKHLVGSRPVVRRREQ